MAKGFRFIYLALHGLVRYKLERRCWRVHGEDVSFTDVKIKISGRKYDRGMWMTLCTGSIHRGFRGIWEKSVSWVLPREKMVDFRLLTVALCRVHTWFGADGWVSIERCISLLMSKNLLTQSFVPELRSRKCFSCFRIPMFYVYMLWTFYVRFTYPYYGYITWSAKKSL